ncbi:MAG: YdeI/OmpD-associated family protein, partial [Chitinophagaceae bacterium]
PGVWLIYYKKASGKPALPIPEAVEEALCFGWIDSLSRKLDDERTMLKFTPRKRGSAWSSLNKTRVKKLIAEKLMTPAGLVLIEAAKKDGSWDKLNNSDEHAKNNTFPPDLEKALKRNKKALANFIAFPPGYRKQFLFWIDTAKQTSTRTARINQTVMMAAANKKPGVSGFKL